MQNRPTTPETISIIISPSTKFPTHTRPLSRARETEGAGFQWPRIYCAIRESRPIGASRLSWAAEPRGDAPWAIESRPLGAPPSTSSPRNACPGINSATPSNNGFMLNLLIAAHAKRSMARGNEEFLPIRR
jgi:hypothetical protein